jgi:hypothetical protein
VIPYITIDTRNPANFYSEFEISDDNFEALVDMVESGFENEAIDILADEYFIPASSRYDNTIRTYLVEMASGPMRLKDHDALLRNISLLTLGLISYFNDNFAKFVKETYVKSILEKADITDSALKKSISNEVISEYERLISGTFSQTQNFILNSIRTMQREMISENLLIKNSGITGEALESEILRFKESLRIKYPQIYRAASQGNLIQISRFDGEIQKTRHYKIDYYIDLTTRTTLLNADRNANIVSALINNENVMEYALIDDRKVQKDREICQHILNKKVNGLSILALDQATADRYGIMTVDEAKSTPDFALGPYCRHGLIRCSKEYLKELELGSR